MLLTENGQVKRSEVRLENNKQGGHMTEITQREQCIFEIARLEWEMFQKVYNTGGRASCQDDPDTFFKMRMSQWMVYSDELLHSYREDCQKAILEGRNLIFEKYTIMMETTYPAEYMNLKQYLPVYTEEQKECIEKIVQIHLKWDQEMYEKYPEIRQKGRVMTTKEDSPENGSSMESYLRAELLTFSINTLELFEKETNDAILRGDNLLMETIKNETAFYGYSSLEEAQNQK